MTERSARDRLRLAGLVLSRGASRVWRRALSPVRRATAGRTRAPVRLLIAPQDIRTADPTAANDIYSGFFSFDGKTVNTHGRSPFSLPPPSSRWAESLAEFGWLRHLRAADTSLARANARALVDDWITLAGRPRGAPEWRTHVVARRLLAWLSQSPLILDGADAVFYRRFMRSIARHVVVLRGALRGGLSGETRLFAAIALAEAGLCAEGLVRLRRQAVRLLVAELERQILPDGGHVSRNPGALVALLLDLLPLRQAFVAAGVPPPQVLLNSIDRMMPMLRTFRHADGTLALFNGMGATEFDALATVLAHDETGGRPLGAAPHSGYQRLEAGSTVVIMDAGRAPPIDFAGAAHAGTLAFELSAGGHRIVVNCGVPRTGSPAARDVARATAAHSTLVIGGRSSGRFAPLLRLGGWLQGVLFSGPERVEAERHETSSGARAEGSHDGYLNLFGVIHSRTLELRGPAHLRGSDHFAPARPGRLSRSTQSFELRFHLHPAVRTRQVEPGSVEIALPDASSWTFEASGLPVVVEDSVAFAAADGGRKSEQLVVRGELDHVVEVVWSFVRGRRPGDIAPDL